MSKNLIIVVLFLSTVVLSKFQYMDSSYKIYDASEDDIDKIFDQNAALLVGQYENYLESTGWSFLFIQTNGNYSDYQQMYAAGYYEGYSSWLEIWNAWNNFNNGGLNGAGTLPGEAQPFVTNQTNWALSMFQSNPNDPYWSLVNVTYSQVFGMYAGYIAQIGNNSQYYLTFDQFYFLTNMGDLEDIVPGFQNLSAVLNSCTGFIKLTEDDLISAHTTWNTYSYMLRVFKEYIINLNNPLVNSKQMILTARPGDLESKDDYYILDSNLVVMETSFNNYNTSNYGYFHYESLPCWVRVLVSNRLARNGTSWSDYFFSYRSGTHNNQWVVVDYNKYESYKSNLSASKDIVWIVEEFYYLNASEDVTQSLLIPQKFVGTYNTPLNQAIYNVTGYVGFNYFNAPRAVLMNQYNTNVTDVNSAKKFIRSGAPDMAICMSAISARCDLVPTTLNYFNAWPFGAIDGKVTNSELLSQMTTWIVSSPPYEDKMQPFDWNLWDGVPHQGMPNVYDFDWMLYTSPTIDVSLSNYDILE